MRTTTLEREVMKTPEVAWPTLAATAGAAAAVFAGLHLQSFLLAALGAFYAFTPIHDASHGSVGRGRALNAWTGRIAGLLMGGSFVAFRYMHLEHHRFTNEGMEKDPDHWSGEGPWFLLPLRWSTQESRYYWLWVRRWPTRPAGERREFILNHLALLAFAAGLAAVYGVEVVLGYWILPGRAAVAALALFNDYLPHRPHSVAQKDDRFRATHALTDPLLTPLLLWQNLHVIHHLYPGIPFYRYGKVWRAQRGELLSRGTREIRLF